MRTKEIIQKIVFEIGVIFLLGSLAPSGAQTEIPVVEAADPNLIHAYFAPGREITDAVGLRYKFRVNNNQSSGLKIIFNGLAFYNPGTGKGRNYFLENNIYSNWIKYSDNQYNCQWPPQGQNEPGQAGFWVSISDYWKSGLVGVRQINENTKNMFPRQNSGIDNISGLTKIETISQMDINGKDVSVEILRGDILKVTEFIDGWGYRYVPDQNNEENYLCESKLPPAEYRKWNVISIIDNVTYQHEFLIPESHAKYIHQDIKNFFTEFFKTPGLFQTYFWDIEVLKENSSIWEPIRKWKVGTSYGGTDSRNNGFKLTTYAGHPVIEVSNAETDTYYKIGDIFELPISSFSANPINGQAPLQVQFIDISTPQGSISGWRWDFDNDGMIDSAEQNPVHTYTNIGTYTISLTVSLLAGSDTKRIHNFITVTAPDTTPPTVSIIQPRDGEVVKDTVTIKASASDDRGVNRVEFEIDSILHSADNTSPYEYSWDTKTVSDGLHSIKAKTYDDADNSAEDSIKIKVNRHHHPKLDHPPKARAGEDQRVRSQGLVKLDGSKSSDPDGDPLTYQWRQIAGPEVVLSGNDQAIATFSAPEVKKETELKFELKVSAKDKTDKDRTTVLVRPILTGKIPFQATIIGKTKCQIELRLSAVSPSRLGSPLGYRIKDPKGKIVKRGVLSRDFQDRQGNIHYETIDELYLPIAPYTAELRIEGKVIATTNFGGYNTPTDELSLEIPLLRPIRGERNYFEFKLKAFSTQQPKACLRYKIINQVKAKIVKKGRLAFIPKRRQEKSFYTTGHRNYLLELPKGNYQLIIESSYGGRLVRELKLE